MEWSKKNGKYQKNYNKIITTIDNNRYTLFLLAIFSLFLCMSIFIQARSILLYDETSDFSAYFAAASIKSEFGEGIYSRERFFETEASATLTAGVREYLYSPLFAEILSIILPKDYTNARLVWLVIEHFSTLLLLLATSLLLFRIEKIEYFKAILISLLVIIPFSPIERSFHYGQASLVIALLIALALCSHYYKREYLGAFFAALGTILKIYPIVYLIALLMTGKFKPALAMVSFLILIPGFSILVFGLSDWITFIQFQAGNPLVDRGSPAGPSMRAYEVPDYSPAALLYLFSDQYNLGWLKSETWTAVRVFILATAVAIYVVLWKEIYHRFQFSHIVALGLSGIMLMSPLLWNHVFIMLIPCIAVIIHQVVFNERSSLSLNFLVITAFCLIAFPDFLTNASFTNNGALILLKYTKLYGLIILALVICKSNYFRVSRH